MNGLNIKEFRFLKEAGVVLNEWYLPEYDAAGYEKNDGGQITLALTYGRGYSEFDALQLVAITNGRTIIPTFGDKEDEFYFLETLGYGDAEAGERAIAAALDWAEEHLDPHNMSIYSVIEAMREEFIAVVVWDAERTIGEDEQQ